MITRRKPLARSTKPLKRTPIRRVSKRRRADIARYSALRATFLADRILCEVEACLAPCSEVHHTQGRGKNYLTVSTWLAVCRPHHERIHANPSWARNMGYIL